MYAVYMRRSCALLAGVACNLTVGATSLLPLSVTVSSWDGRGRRTELRYLATRSNPDLQNVGE